MHVYKQPATSFFQIVKVNIYKKTEILHHNFTLSWLFLIFLEL